MKKDILLSLGFSTRKELSEKIKVAEAVLSNIAIEDEAVKVKMEQYFESAETHLIEGFLYSTIEMGIKEIETACSHLVEGKRDIMMFDVYYENYLEKKQINKSIERLKIGY